MIKKYIEMEIEIFSKKQKREKFVKATNDQQIESVYENLTRRVAPKGIFQKKR